MKKSMMLLACMVTILLQGMENPKSIEYQLELTLVQLTQGSIYDIADGNVKIIVVSKNEQDRLQQRSIMYDKNLIGNAELVKDNLVYINNKTIDNFSDIQKRTLKSRVISVVEPTFDEDHNRFKKELVLCYNKVLTAAVAGEKSAYTQEELQEKSIALPLSFGTGYDVKKRVPIIEKAIIKFIASNYGKYARMHLFVDTEWEFDLYKALLAERYRIRQSHYFRCI